MAPERGRLERPAPSASLGVECGRRWKGSMTPPPNSSTAPHLLQTGLPFGPRNTIAAPALLIGASATCRSMQDARATFAVTARTSFNSKSFAGGLRAGQPVCWRRERCSVMRDTKVPRVMSDNEDRYSPGSFRDQGDIDGHDPRPARAASRSHRATPESGSRQRV